MNDLPIWWFLRYFIQLLLAGFVIIYLLKASFWVFLFTGDFIVVEPIPEGVKVRAEIVHILYPKQIKTLKEDKEWLATNEW